MRSSQPIRATQLKIQASSAWPETADWGKMTAQAGVDSGGDVGGRDFARLGGQGPGILPGSDRVEVDHAVQALHLVLQGDELHQRAEIIAQV